MGLLAVAATDVETAVLDPAALDQLQLEQFQHDEMYHREIARLSTQDRLKHMALHFAKYAGNLAESELEDEDALRKAVTDTFIIAVSTANTLNVRLSEVLANTSASGSGPFRIALIVHAGRMAAACEKLDHLEDFAFRPVIRERAIALLRAAAMEAEAHGWGIADLVRARLAGVKQKMIFHGQKT